MEASKIVVTEIIDSANREANKNTKVYTPKDCLEGITNAVKLAVRSSERAMVKHGKIQALNATVKATLETLPSNANNLKQLSDSQSLLEASELSKKNSIATRKELEGYLTSANSGDLQPAIDYLSEKSSNDESKALATYKKRIADTDKVSAEVILPKELSGITKSNKKKLMKRGFNIKSLVIENNAVSGTLRGGKRKGEVVRLPLTALGIKLED